MSAPKRVYLQWGEELPGAPDPYLDEVTWTPERAGPEDVEYVHVAEVERLTADLAAARAERDRLAKALAEVRGIVAADDAAPLRVGEPAESIDIGRAQLADEVRAALAALPPKEEA